VKSWHHSDAKPPCSSVQCEDEEKIQEGTWATIRVIPIDQPGGKGKCAYTGNEAEKVAGLAGGY